MRRRIGIQFIVAVGLITAIAMLVFAGIIFRSQQQQLLHAKIVSANQLSDTIKKSTRQDMLMNRLDNVYLIIKTIGEQEGIEKVRIIEKMGQVIFSTHENEIGSSLDMHAESCYACHETNKPLEQLDTPQRTRVFRDKDGKHLLGIINPIYNEPSCSTADCHYHPADKRVLGVLDITMFLGDIDSELQRTRNTTIVTLLVAFLVVSLLIYLFVNHRVLNPLQTAVQACKKVAGGDLDVILEAKNPDEIGLLFESFNNMTSKLAQAQMQVSQSDKLASVGRLAAGVAHEINNPLTGVLTYSSFLLKRAEEYPEIKEDLEVIVRETKRCREIVKGLLDFSRQSTFRKSDSDLNAVVDRAVEVIANQANLKNIMLVKNFQSKLPLVCADANQLQQVVLNLLVNASDAIENNGEIVITTRSVLVPPRGNEQIRSAFCPNGCSLVNEHTRIRNIPAITVDLKDAQGRASIHYDPVFGSANHVYSRDVNLGTLIDVRCPKCDSSLTKDNRKCPKCGSVMFSVRSNRGSEIFWCAKRGCHHQEWAVLEVAGDREYIEVEVRDDGAGMDSNTLSMIFEPFFSTKGPRGTGLGLAVSWGIVRNHGGIISVVSEPGKGTTITVRIPVEVLDSSVV